jgi:hypothetical protein
MPSHSKNLRNKGINRNPTVNSNHSSKKYRDKTVIVGNKLEVRKHKIAGGCYRYRNLNP